MSCFMGIDIGSGTSKAAIICDAELAAFHLVPSGVNYRLACEKLSAEVLSGSGLCLEDIANIAVTGTGASSVPFKNREIADIRCCARGINRIFPEVRLVIDIQGQSSQVVRLNERGQVVNFAVGEKCAAGSGRFLEIIANVLQVDLKDIAELARKSANPVVFTTGCAVFGESEAVSRVAEGVPVEDILAGVLQALAERISSLVEKVGFQEQGAICGGGALNAGLVRKLEEKLGSRLMVPPRPQMVNALGAAVLAAEIYSDNKGDIRG